MSETPDPRSRDREARARAAIEAISKGANPADEALRLSNSFTDELADGVKRRLRGGKRPEADR